jgi:inosine/xanthosine triphosphatase
MKIGVGSKNKTKVNAVAEVLKDYPLFDGATVEGVAVEVEEFGHPKTLDETIDGAIERAKQAYVGHEYGIGIEGGLMVVPQAGTGYMAVSVCTIFDGSHIHLGLSPACEWPRDVLDKILSEGLDGGQAMKASGLTAHEKVGVHGGVIEVLTKGRTNRTEQNKWAIMMALTQLEHPEHF